MTKTRLLFAFGNHGQAEVKCSTRFFKKAVVPFAERNAKEGRKVYVIKEWVTSERNFKTFPEDNKKRLLEGDPRALAWIQKVLDSNASRVNENMSKRYGVGLIPGELETGMKPWGCEEGIAKINKAKNGSVVVLVEPQDGIAFCHGIVKHEASDRIADAIMKGPPEYAVELMRRYILSISAQSVARDKRLVELIEKLDAEGAPTAIAVPRGAAHLEMLCLLEKDKYDISVEHNGHPPRFMDQAMQTMYHRELTDEEADIYAMKEAAMRMIMAKKFTVPLIIKHILSMWEFTKPLSEKIDNYIVKKAMTRVNDSIERFSALPADNSPSYP